MNQQSEGLDPNNLSTDSHDDPKDYKLVVLDGTDYDIMKNSAARFYEDKRIFAIQESTKTRFSFFQRLNEKLRLRFRWYYNWRINPRYLYPNIDDQLVAIQRSTKTNFKTLLPLHNKLRQISPWYYNWHIRPQANKIHFSLAGLYILAVFVGVMYSAFGWPVFRAHAANYSCSFNGSVSSDWNNASNWDTCNSEYPGQTGSNSYDVTVPTTKSVTLNVNNLDLTGGGTSNGNISITGTLATSNNNITALSVTVNAGGTLTAGSSTITVKGNWTSSSSTSTVNVGTSTVNIINDSTIATRDWAQNFYNLKTAYTGKTITWSGNGLVSRQLQLDGDDTASLVASSASYGPVMSGNGSGYDLITSNGATFGSTVRVLFIGANAIIPGGISYPMIEFAASDYTQTLAGNVTTSGLVGIYGGTSKTSTLDLNGYTLTVGSDLRFGAGYTNTRYGKIVNSSQTTDASLVVNGALNIPSTDVADKNILDASGSGASPHTINISVAKNWTNAGVFTAGASNVTFTGNASAHQTITTDDQAFYKLTLNNTQATYDDIIISGALDIDNKLTITDGDFDLDTNDPDTTIGGGLEFTHSTNGSIIRGTGSLTFDSYGDWADNGTTKRDIGVIVVGNAVVLTATTSVKATKITVNDEFRLSDGVTLELTGTGTSTSAPLVGSMGASNPDFYAGSGSTVLYSGSGTTTDIATVPFANLTLTPSPSAATTYNLTSSLTSSYAMTGALTIGANATLDVRPASTDYSITATNITIAGTLDATSSSAVITASGNWDSSAGTVTYGTSTVNLTGTGSVATKSWQNIFYNLNCAYDGKTTTFTTTPMITNKFALAGTNGVATSSNWSGASVRSSGSDVFASSGSTMGGSFILFFQGSSSTTIPGGGVYSSNGVYRNITIASSTDNVVFTLGGDITVTDSLAVYADTANRTNIIDLNGYTLTSNKALNIGHNTVTTKRGKIVNNSQTSDAGIVVTTATGAGGLTIYNGDGYNILDASGSGASPHTIDISIARYWTNSDTFTAGGSTVTFTGNSSANQIVTTNGQAFNKLTLNNTQATYDDVIISGALDVNGLLTITDGDLNLSTNNPDTTLGGGLTFSHATNGSITRGSGSLTFDGAGTWTDNGTTKRDLGAVYGSAAVTLGSNVKATLINMAAFDVSGYAATVTGSGDLQDFYAYPITYNSSSEIIFTASSGDIRLLSDSPMPSITINGGASLNVQPTYEGDDPVIDGNFTITSGIFSTEDVDMVVRNLTVNGNLTIGASGTLTADSSTISVKGNWANSGTFTAGTSTVTFNGTSASKTINPGSSSFNILTINGSGGEWTIDTNHLTTTTLNVTAGKLLTGSKNLTVVGTTTLNGGDLTGGAGTMNFGFDGTNAGVGNLTISNASSDFVASATVNTKTEGQYTRSAGTADWTTNSSTFNYLRSGRGELGGGDTYLPLDTYYNLTLGDWGGSSGAHFYLNSGTTNINGNLSLTDSNYCTFYLDTGNTLNVLGNISIGSDGDGTINAQTSVINLYGNLVDNGGNLDAGTGTIDFKKASGTQTVDGGVGSFYNLTHSGAGTLQATTNNLSITGNFTNSTGTFNTSDGTSRNVQVGGNFTISGGTITANASTIAVGGNWDSSAGTFTYGTSTVTMTGTTRTLTVANTTGFYKLSVSGTVTSTGANFTVHNLFSIGGTFTIGASLTATLETTGTLNVSGTLNGNSNSYFTAKTGDSTSTTQIVNTGTINPPWGFYFIATGGSTAAPISATTFNCLVVISGAFASDARAVLQSGTLTTTTVQIYSSADGKTITFDTATNNSTITLSSTFSVGYPSANRRYAIFTPGTGTITTTAVTINASDVGNKNKIDSTGVTTPWAITGNVSLSDTWIAGSSTISVGGNWTNSGTFTAGTSTVTFNGSAAQTITPGASSFYNLISNKTGSGTDDDLTLAASTGITNDLTLTDGEFKPVSYTVTLGGNLSVATASSGITYGTSLFIFDGVGKTISGTKTTLNFYNVTVNAEKSVTDNIATTFAYGTTFTVNGAFTVGDGKTVTFYSSDQTLAIGNGGLLEGTDVRDSMFTLNGDATPTITLTGTGNFGSNLYLHILIGNLSDYTLPSLNYKAGMFEIYANDASCTVTPTVGTLDIDGNFQLSAESASNPILNFYNSNNTAIFFGGNFSRHEGPEFGGTARYTKGTTDTVTFDKTSSTQTFDPGENSTFNNITHSGAGTLQLVDNINISGNLTNSAGTFDANNLNINVAKNWTISGGTFTAGAGTVTFNGTSEATISGSTTFNNLTMDTNADGAKQINFTAGTTQTIGGTWTLDGASGKVLTLRSTEEDTAWKFVIPAHINPAGDWIDVQDSQNTTNAYRITPGANTTNSGNNDPGWNFGITLFVDNATLDFGNLIPGNVFTGYTETTVTVNYLSGYSLSVKDNVSGTNSALLHSDASTRIADFAGTMNAPIPWDGTGLGICAYSFTGKNQGTSKWGSGTTEYDSNNKYSGVPQNDGIPANDTHLFTNSSTTISNDKARIGYKLVVPNTQKSGSYTGTVTYTATATLP